MSELTLTHRTVPAREGAAPHPAFLLLHGRGADEYDLLPLARELDPRLFVISARAPFRFPGGGYMWYDLDPNGVGYPDEATFTHSLSALKSFIAEITETYPIDPIRVYAGGFSMGAAMAATLALTEPGKIAGAAILSGYLPIEAGLELALDDLSSHPMFQAHGALDPVIPVELGRRTRKRLAALPLDLTYNEYQMGHEVNYQELQDLAAWFTAVLDASLVAQSTS